MWKIQAALMVLLLWWIIAPVAVICHASLLYSDPHNGAFGHTAGITHIYKSPSMEVRLKDAENAQTDTFVSI